VKLSGQSSNASRSTRQGLSGSHETGLETMHVSYSAIGSGLTVLGGLPALIFQGVANGPCFAQQKSLETLAASIDLGLHEDENENHV